MFTINLLILTTFVQSSFGHVRNFRLLDHPDGAARPPIYGLRLDNLFQGESGANGGITTFSFETGRSSVYLKVDRTNTTITIRGLMYGGEDSGTGYGYGENHYRINYLYNTGLTSVPNGWISGDVGNQGFIKQGNNFQRELYAKALPNGEAFLFKQDGHRLSDSNIWVGRGWQTYESDHGSGDSGTHDFLFVGEPVPSTRDACWWRDHECHIESLLPITLGDRTFTNSRQVVRFLQKSDDSDAKWEFAHVLLVFKLNIQAFGLEQQTYHDVNFSNLLSNAELTLMEGPARDFKYHMDIINDILTPGEMGAISRDFGPCAKKCTCFCDHHLENFVEDTDSK